ncbi:MAG: outer membrane lipoprotein carrier protein LolA [Desulfobacterales bacterium]
MKVPMGLVVLGLLLFVARVPGVVSAGDADLEEIIRQVEKRYDVPGFTADFHQVSTIKAMDIVDQATGRMFVRKPEMMRWEYEKPEAQIIVTNAEKLWIYRPEDNQVVVGRAPAFFAGGKGAGFLADIRVLRRKFDISLAPSDDDRFHVLRLVPIEKTIDVERILLAVARETHTVQRVVTYNPYGDETLINLVNSRFDQVPDRAVFTFTVPEGADVVTMDE